MDKKRFDNRSALITGCGNPNGIGFATARLLGASGAAVAITSTTDRIFDRARALKETGIRAYAYVADLTDRHQVEALAENVRDDLGRVDILVNNAGMGQVGEPETFTRMANLSWQEWDKSIDRNLNTCFNITRAVLPIMIANRFGRIVNVSSVTGPLVSNPGEAAYSAAKAAMVGMSRSLALEVAEFGITVNNVAPGWIATDAATEEEKAAAMNTPMKRGGTPMEVADLIGFLASDESTYITGQMIVIDGGNSIQEYKGPRDLYY